MSDPGFVNVDTAEWPMVIITYDGSLTDEAFAEHMEDLAAYLQRAEPVVFVSNIARSTLPTESQQRLMGQLLMNEAEPMQRYCRGWAQVASTPELRAAAEAIGEIMNTPTRCFGSVDEARQWARAQLG